MYFTSGSDRAFEQLMQTRPGADHFDSGEAGAPEDCGTCRFYRPHWKYQFCVYEECPYQPGKLTALDGAVKFQVKGVDDEMAVFRVEKNRGYAQQLYEKKLLTYPRTDSQYLTDDMLPTAESLVSGLWPMLPFAAGLDLSPQFGRVLNSKKVSDHHAIVPTMEFVQRGFDGLTEGEKKLLSLVCCKLLCAVAAPHVYEAVTATFTCAGNTFTAKGKTILTPGWKELDRRFKASFKTDADDTAPEPARELPQITEGQTFDKVTAAVTEHFTAPPKSYTEDNKANDNIHLR